MNTNTDVMPAKRKMDALLEGHCHVEGCLGSGNCVCHCFDCDAAEQGTTR